MPHKLKVSISSFDVGPEFSKYLVFLWLFVCLWSIKPVVRVYL